MKIICEMDLFRAEQFLPLFRDRALKNRTINMGPILDCTKHVFKYIKE